MTTVFIISAPSGSGKSTLVGRLFRDVPDLCFSVSFTTRPRRGAEADGVDYHFITHAEFERRLEGGEFLEHAKVFGNYYGTHRSALEIAAVRCDDLVLDIDVQGAAQLKRALPEAVTIFVLASFPGNSRATASLTERRPGFGHHSPPARRGHRNSKLQPL